MEQLQRLSLISKITTEIRNHWGVEDKTLAEFVISLGEQSATLEEFREKLAENGAEAEDESPGILFSLIERMGKKQLPSRPAKKAATKATAEDVETDPQRRQFRGLAMRNDADHVQKMDADASAYGAEPSEAAQKLLVGEMNPKEREKYDREQRKKPRRRDSRARSRSRSGRGSPRRRTRKAVELHEIFEGEVCRVMDFGCFVKVDSEDGSKEGLVHVSEITNDKTRSIRTEDYVKRGQKVFVKIVGLAKQKLSLSMREVDQDTGKDLVKKREAGPRATRAAKAGYGAITGVKLDATEGITQKHKFRQKKQLSDIEIWEMRQMQSSGVLAPSEFMNFDKDQGLLFEEVAEEDFEIELVEREPAFLSGQTAKAGVQLSPVEIVREPDGSLNRAASAAVQKAKDRRDQRDAMQESLLKSIPKDMGRSWEDPQPEAGERIISSALQGVGQAAYEMPEWKKLGIGKSVSYGQRSSKPIKEQRESLPIFKLRDQLLQAISENQALVVIGETGSGKTTQMPQYLAEAGYASRGIIGCTQPRRVAASSVARRVSEEFGCRCGQEVGYAIRFEDVTCKDTMIKYMTDGFLLREVLSDSKLSRYSVIMLDEAHERTVSTDILFGLTKQALRERPELKVIVTSATLDAEKFSSYFFDSHIFTIPGRTFPVEIMYSKEPEPDYVEAALMTVLQIHLTEPSGDILVFLTGQEEIDTSCQVLHERMQKLESMNPPPLLPMPVYSALPSEQQSVIFDPAPAGCRKCIVATNIAEASLTIDGIFYVVDPGFAKTKMYNPKTSMDSLTVTPISQANARQRAGRAGRTGPGKCYRLYTEIAYRNEMLPTAVPEIQRTSLANVVLVLKAMGINDLLAFDFMDPPPVQAMISALEGLWTLTALDDEGLLTKQGKLMAEFPMDPALSKMLLVACDLGCADEVITIASLLQVQNVFYRPKEKQVLADQKKSQFLQPEGDHITLLEVYKAWQRNRMSNAWCYENFLQARTLRRCQDVRKQLIMHLDRYKMPISSAGNDYTIVRKSICAGYFNHAIRRDQGGDYKTLVDHKEVHIHPSSALHQQNPDWAVYHELVLTTKEYVRELCTLDPHWLPEIAPNLFQKADESRLSKRKMREIIEPLYNRYEGADLWRLSKR